MLCQTEALSDQIAYWKFSSDINMMIVLKIDCKSPQCSQEYIVALCSSVFTVCNRMEAVWLGFYCLVRSGFGFRGQHTFVTVHRVQGDCRKMK